MNKQEFPLLNQNPGLSYLDNAATTQKPQQVIDAISCFYETNNANVHRGIYPLSESATDLYESSRETVANFIDAATKEIVFTGGTTDGLNMLANILANSNIVPTQPQILISDKEHHGNLLPWQQVSKNIAYLSINEDYQYDLSDSSVVKFESGEFMPLKEYTPDIVAITHVSNVTGALTDIKEIRDKFPKAILVIDAAQSIAHYPISTKELDVDFLVFGAHKMYGPTGIGVLYGKQALLEQLPPAKVGGGMINKVERNQATWAPLPEKFEAGTPPIAQAVGTAAAINYLENIGWEKLQHHESQLSTYTYQKLAAVDGLELFHPANPTEHAGVFSFTIEGVHPHDLAQVLGEHEVCVRAGHHCTQILHREVLKIPATARASLAIYNNQQDVDRLVEAIENAKRTFNI